MTKINVNNLILMTDSYKHSHFLQYPPELRFNSAYIEARSSHKLLTMGLVDRKVLFYGLQIFLKKVLSVPVTLQDVKEAKAFLAIQGEPFNEEGWLRIVNVHNGYLPLEIQALPEGTVVKHGVPLVQITNTDPELPWLTSFIETALLRSVWYPTSVATVSWMVKQIAIYYLNDTSDDPMSNLMFRLNDFGARGVSSAESAGIGGSAHLVNFMGSDTIEGIMTAMNYYNTDVCGFSIPAAEHSTITSWGKDREAKAYANMVDKFAGNGKMYAVVSDSYDLMNAVDNIWGEQLYEKLFHAGGTLVVRPDSGDPTKVAVEVVESLGKKFGYSVNKKGYKVLDPSVRVIQGDGMNIETIDKLFENLKWAGWSVENVAIGMGGKLLQGVDRDTLNFAMKTNAVDYGDGWVDVNKNPKTDPSKKSKAGRQMVVKINGEIIAAKEGTYDPRTNMLTTVWKDGKLLKDWTFEEVRNNSNG